ncbi:hypothetical protein A1F94_005117 [Pyrenophora tritici-repentis]|nr:hypothetical protein A1F94_005117 [Pyrenophora tritici-repentis]
MAARSSQEKAPQTVTAMRAHQLLGHKLSGTEHLQDATTGLKIGTNGKGDPWTDDCVSCIQRQDEGRHQSPSRADKACRPFYRISIDIIQLQEHGAKPSTTPVEPRIIETVHIPEEEYDGDTIVVALYQKPVRQLLSPSPTPAFEGQDRSPSPDPVEQQLLQESSALMDSSPQDTWGGTTTTTTLRSTYQIDIRTMLRNDETRISQGQHHHWQTTSPSALHRGSPF